MATRLSPYLNFPGNTREAMEFYRDVLGGTLSITTFGEFGIDGVPADGVMHAALETEDGLTLMASDLMPGMDHAPGTNFTIGLTGDDDARLRECWDRLQDGATVRMPLEKQVWGDVYGDLVDRFGIAWLVDIGEPPE